MAITCIINDVANFLIQFSVDDSWMIKRKRQNIHYHKKNKSIHDNNELSRQSTAMDSDTEII